MQFAIFLAGNRDALDRALYSVVHLAAPGGYDLRSALFVVRYDDRERRRCKLLRGDSQRYDGAIDVANKRRYRPDRLARWKSHCQLGNKPDRSACVSSDREIRHI